MALRGRGVEISPPNLAKTTTEENARACKIGSFLLNLKIVIMGKGRPKTLDEVKVMRGTDQPCRMSSKTDIAEKITDIRQITSTAKMKLLPTKRSKDIFKQKANQLIALGVMTELDVEQLALYAYSLDFVFTCMGEIRKNVTKDDRTLDVISSKEVNLMFKAMDYVNRIGADFGFTPMSRQKINHEKKKETDELTEYLNSLR